MKNNIKESKKEINRRKLIDAAAKVFSENGYVETSIKNITDEAGMAVGSFYTHFTSKEDILAQIYEEISLLSVKTALEVCTDDKNVVKKFVMAMTCTICVYVKNKNLAKILLIKSMGINETFEKKQWEILNNINNFLTGILKHLKEEHDAIINDINICSVILSQSIFGVITNWLRDELKCDLKQVIFTLCTYNLRAMGISFSDEDVNEYIASEIKK